MVHWIQTNGMEALLIYYVLISIIGSMPPVPPDAGYYAKWAYMAAHAIAGNMRALAHTINMPDPPEKGQPQ